MRISFGSSQQTQALPNDVTYDVTSPLFCYYRNYLTVLQGFYCMPEEGVELAPKAHLLSDDEIIRLAEMFVKQGVTKIRLTGGEPTVRKGVIELVGKCTLPPPFTHPAQTCQIGRLNELRQYGLRSIGMTSNGIALHRMFPRLVENGLTHLNLR